MTDIVDVLLESDEPAIRFKTLVNVCGEDPDSAAIKRMRRQVRESAIVQKLLSQQGRDGRITKPANVYAKWQGAHWIMAILADIGYPERDKSLIPVRDQLLDHWLAPDYFKEFESHSRQHAYKYHGVPVMEGRPRRCVSQQSNALWSIMRLGLLNERTHELAERLLHWQWPDGGWNCDKKPEAHNSSFMESILPMRALALYGQTFGHTAAERAAKRASEIFLKRHLHLRQQDGKVMRAEFAKLHYPLYWHYDILHGLKVLAESELINDPRAQAALELLLEKRLDGGGWPAEASYYKASSTVANGNDFINWGGTGKKMNPWVTVDALFVERVARASQIRGQISGQFT